MTPRAQRFPFEGLLSFRPVGQMEWKQGMMINVSSSGVLFRTHHPAPVENVVQLVCVIPPQIPGKECDVVCYRGQIVRAKLPDGSDRQTHLAAKLLEFSPSRP